MSDQDADDAGPDETAPASGTEHPADDGDDAEASTAFADPLDALEEAPDVTDVEPPTETVDYVANGDPEAVATRLAALRTRIDALESQLDAREDDVADLESRLARKQADFQNYKKRQEKRLEEEKQRATEDLVTRLLDVRDNLARALDQDADADIRDGVASTLRQFDAELDAENVSRIDPEPGDAVDPERHEVLVSVESDQPEDAIAAVHRPGYEMAGKILQAAQVTVSEGPAATADDEETDADT